MKIFWISSLLFISIVSHAQVRLARVLADPAISWAAVSEIKIDLDDARVYAEQFIGWDYNWVSTVKIDVSGYADFPPDKFFSHLLVENLVNGKQNLYSLETKERLDFPELRKQLVSRDTVFHNDGERFEIYQYPLPVERLFDYFVLKQLWYYNRSSHTFHNYLLGIIPVHVHPGETGPVHRRLGWIPFSAKETDQVEINGPGLIWIKRAAGYAYFSDWAIKKGDTPGFIEEYFFTLPRQGIIEVGPDPSGPPVPLQPPLTNRYMEKMNAAGKTNVIFYTAQAREDILRFVEEPSADNIKKVVGLTVSQYFFIDRRTMQLGSHLDMIGPLIHGYAGDPDPQYPQEYLIHLPAYFILDPTNNGQ